MEKLQQFKLQNRLTVIGQGDTMIIRAPAPNAPRPPGAIPGVHPALRTRLEALHMLTEAGDNKQASEALRDVALDLRQAVPIRITAVYSLGTMNNPENTAILLEVARADSNMDVQRTAIEMFAQSATDRKRAVDELITLFRRFDAAQPVGDPRLGTTLYSIATIGDERATDFLADIARSHRDEDLRSSAVFYLGSMGTERSRAALIRVLRGE